MQLLRRFSLFLFFFAIGGCASDPVSIKDINARIAKEGPNNYLRKTINDQALWFRHIEVLQQGLKSGNAGALEAVSKLRSVSDAGASTTLDFMVARAIPDNPGIVSESAENGFELNRICNIPYIEVEQRIVDDYVRRVASELRRQRLSGDAKAGECLTILESRLTKTTQ